MNVETADEFAILLFEEAKAFLEKYRSRDKDDSAVAYLHAALVLGYSALEAHINNVGLDFAERPELGILEQSVLQERDFALNGGRFELSNRLKMYRLEDRLKFLYRLFEKQPLNESESPWWSSLKAGLDLRNAITHPRMPRVVIANEVSDFLVAIIEAIDALFRTVYGKPYPGRGRQLDSLLSL